MPEGPRGNYWPPSHPAETRSSRNLVDKSLANLGMTLRSHGRRSPRVIASESSRRIRKTTVTYETKTMVRQYARTPVNGATRKLATRCSPTSRTRRRDHGPRPRAHHVVEDGTRQGGCHRSHRGIEFTTKRLARRTSTPTNSYTTCWDLTDWREVFTFERSVSR